ncbi:MAG: glycoside hydrolase family 20 zincin-like fold domain-containing protein [Candidatus Pacebacteria bacterium]|nr:glycoside hydrolase family 20 zincin-like fold domain-containing protein [Candidatus Paceibacterota bacterium]
MAAINQSEIETLLPGPRHIEIVDGTTELCSDVRLATSNVLPYMRKTMRTIFSAANVRIVANKKKFVIHVNILEDSDIDYCNCPEVARDDYYRMQIIDNVVTIEASSQTGAVWGTQTFAHLISRAGAGVIIPNIILADWAETRKRGLCIPANHTSAHMHLDEWGNFLDRMVELKLNTMIVDVFGHSGTRTNPIGAEFLLTSFDETDELKTANLLCYYSPVKGEWLDSEELIPVIAQENGFTDLVNATNEKGISLLPAFTPIGCNYTFTSAFPDLKAKGPAPDDNGRIPTCLSSEKARNCLATIYGKLIETYFPDGLEYLLIQLDRLPPADEESLWCQCNTCAGQSPATIVKQFCVWLVEMLSTKGVNIVLLQNALPDQTLDILNEDLATELDNAGLGEKVGFVAQGCAQDTSATIYGALTGPNKSESWLATGNDAYGYPGDQALTTVALSLTKTAMESNVHGFYRMTAPHPVCHDSERLIAKALWKADGKNATDDARTVAESAYGENAEDYQTAVSLLRDLFAENKALAVCYPWIPADARLAIPYTVKQALDQLGTVDNATAQLEDAGKKAQQAVDALTTLLKQTEDEGCTIPSMYVTVAESLLAEAYQVSAVAKVYGALFPFRENLASGTKDDATKDACAGAKDDLLSYMALTQNRLPRYAIPDALYKLSVLSTFLDEQG